MSWRVAKSLDVLLDQINQLAPRRNKVSDGSIGDAAHAARKSDHDPWVKDGNVGIVTARDFTHDPSGGFDAYKFADTLKENHDPRVKYVISNRRIWNPDISPDWRHYSGINPHDHHTHVSVKADKGHYDDTALWDLSGLEKPVAITTPRALPTKPSLKKGAESSSVQDLQRLLNAAGANPQLNVDGQFGQKTLNAVMAFQKARGLVRDGVVGTYTWVALEDKAPSAPEYGSPAWAIAFLKTLGWSDVASIALVANLMWESGGHAKNAIFWDAKGDKGKDGLYHSGYAPQWNDRHGRKQAFEAYADDRGMAHTDPEAQLSYLNHELATTEVGPAKLLKNASTIEDAAEAALTFWRPSIPHTDQRLAIARKLSA